MRRFEHIYQSLEQGRHFENASWERVFFEEARFWSTHFENCVWTNCKFNKTAFANGCVFRNCRFSGCRFWGQHTHMGGPSLFENCQFIDCRFQDVTFWETTLRNCRFTGTLSNIAFFGPGGPPEWLSTFDRVDLGEAELKSVEFRFGFDLTATRLPEGTSGA